MFNDRSMFFRVWGLLLVSVGFVTADGSPSDPQTLSVPRRPFLAVMPLTRQDIDEVSSLMATDVISDKLLRTGDVRVMERTQIESILKEKWFHASGSCDGDECFVEMGTVLPVDKMLVGAIGKLCEAFRISVREVDVASGGVVGFARRMSMSKGDIEEGVADLAPKSASDLAVFLNAAPTSDSIADAVLPVAGGESVQAVEPSVLALAASPQDPAAVPVVPKDSSAVPVRKSTWEYWGAGGVLAAGCVIAAILLMQSDEEDLELASTSWQTTVEWK